MGGTELPLVAVGRSGEQSSPERLTRRIVALLCADHFGSSALL